MSNFAASLVQMLTRPAEPVRELEVTRLRLSAAVFASLVAALVLLLAYYLTLGLLPPTYVSLQAYHPTHLWNQRFDIAQFFGTLIFPPNATSITWWIGLAAWTALLIGFGAAGSILCSWSVRTATVPFGAAIGAALFFILGSSVSLGSGFNPAVMRQNLPDVGFFFLGWTGWAAIQLFACCTAYGLTWGALYSR